MRSQHAAQKVMRGADIGHPVAHGFVDGVLQGARTRVHAAHLGAQQLHAEDVQLLPPHVFRPHVNHALHAKERAHGCGRDPVLAGAGFGDDAMLAHASRQQRLPDAVVDLVRAGVQQVFPLQIDLGAAKLLGEPLGQEQRCRTPREIGQQAVELVAKCLVFARHGIGSLEFLQRRHQGLRNVAPAIGTKSSRDGTHTRLLARLAERWTRRRNSARCWLFLPWFPSTAMLPGFDALPRRSCAAWLRPSFLLRARRPKPHPLPRAQTSGWPRRRFRDSSLPR